uniref:Ciliogenesis and planar polarity effector 2 n=1 Tax=Sus scrofa TaxID=9823 RepID=A0A8D0MR86_PIG
MGWLSAREQCRGKRAMELLCLGVSPLRILKGSLDTKIRIRRVGLLHPLRRELGLLEGPWADEEGSQVQLGTVALSHLLLSAFCHLPSLLGCPAMARPPTPGSVIVPDWHESAEGKEYLACILRKNRRRVFGLLERPVLPPPVAVDTASYKIFVSGKSGVGKTALVAKLAGLEVPVVHHETTGIQTTVVFWPAKLQASNRVVMFRFEFWDCGESALKKFDHMLPACKEKADAFLFLFSFTDRASFEDLPGQLARVAGEAPGVVRMVIGSKFDQYMHTDVPECDLTAFRQAWELPLLRVKSVPGRRLADGRTLDGRAGLADVAHVLNGLAEQLWHQDQVAAGLLPNSPEDTPS